MAKVSDEDLILSADFLLKGAFYAVERACELLRDAVYLRNNKSYATSLVLAVFSLEEVGRAKIILKNRHQVLQSHRVTHRALVKELKDHRLKQKQVNKSIGSREVETVWGDEQAGEELDERLNAKIRGKTKRAPEETQSKRERALYVDLEPQENRWNIPSAEITWSDAEKKISAAREEYLIVRDHLLKLEATSKKIRLPSLPESCEP